jgi:hypothetical protein
MNKPVAIGMICIAAVASAPVAASPRSVRKMDSVAIRSVPVRKLCDAYGVYLRSGQTFSSNTDEMKRRGIDCAEAVEQNVSNCSMLEVVAVEPVAPGATAYTIRNTSPKLKEFRIHQAGMVSSRFTIEPGQTRGYGVRSDPRISKFAGVGAQLRGETGGELTDCLTTTWR